MNKEFKGLYLKEEGLMECAVDGDCGCTLCTISPSTVVLEKCKLTDSENIFATGCPTQNKRLELTINFTGLCPKGDFTRLAVCVTISVPYTSDDDLDTQPATHAPFATDCKSVDLPNTGTPCGTSLSVPFTFCLDEPICSDRNIDVSVCAHYIF